MIFGWVFFFSVMAYEPNQTVFHISDEYIVRNTTNRIENFENQSSKENLKAFWLIKREAFFKFFSNQYSNFSSIIQKLSDSNLKCERFRRNSYEGHPEFSNLKNYWDFFSWMDAIYVSLFANSLKIEKAFSETSVKFDFSLIMRKIQEFEFNIRFLREKLNLYRSFYQTWLFDCTSF